MGWSPVLVPDRLEPVTIPVAATLDGVIAPRVSEIAGVVVGFVTIPLTPLAVVTETEVTVPAAALRVDQTGLNGVPVLTWKAASVVLNKESPVAGRIMASLSVVVILGI